MKATGIVRRIDDLGRIVIPKEIRKTFHIKESDPMEALDSHCRLSGAFDYCVIDYKAVPTRAAGYYRPRQFAFQSHHNSLYIAK